MQSSLDNRGGYEQEQLLENYHEQELLRARGRTVWDMQRLYAQRM
jgi:hypothetical protein